MSRTALVTPLRIVLGLLLLAGPALAQPVGPMGKEVWQDDERRERMGEQRGWEPRGGRDERRAERRAAEDAREFLQEAQEAMQEGRFGRANEYLERAATRLLSRSTEPSRAQEPMRDRSLGHISEAREALARRNPRRAMRQIDRAIESLEG